MTNLYILDGMEIKGSELNLLFYNPDNTGLKAQYWLPNKGEDVITEIPIKSWKNAISALCTFLHLNGEPKEQIRSKVQKIINGIQNNLVESK
jgi:hypothetical protein